MPRQFVGILTVRGGEQLDQFAHREPIRTQARQKRGTELVDVVRRQSPAADVEGGFLELAPPPIQEAVAKLVAGGHEVIDVVPLVLVAAGHSKGDIPADYQCNVSFALAKRLKRPPREVAAEIAARLAEEGGMVASAEAAGPGFVNLVLADGWLLERAAKQLGLKLSAKKSGFLYQGDDRVGAMTRVFAKLAAAKINLIAVDAVAGGKGRFGAIFWVKPEAVAKTARLLGAK